MHTFICCHYRTAFSPTEKINEKPNRRFIPLLILNSPALTFFCVKEEQNRISEFFTSRQFEFVGKGNLNE
jgi:hypothetical protein